MSVIHGSTLNGNWGLVRQIGPWKPTSRDRVGAGYTQSNVDVIRPYVVRGDKPQPKLSKWGQNSIVSKSAYRPGVSRIGKKTDSVGSILKGIHHTLLGLGARGSGMGVGQGLDGMDNNGYGNQGKGYGGEDAGKDSSEYGSLVEFEPELKGLDSPGTEQFNNFLGTLDMVKEPIEEEFFEAVGGEEVKEDTRSYGLYPGHGNTMYAPKPNKPEMVEVKKIRGNIWI